MKMSSRVRATGGHLLVVFLFLGGMATAGPVAAAVLAGIARTPPTRVQIIRVLVDLCGNNPARSANALRRMKEIGLPAIRAAVEWLGNPKVAAHVLPLIIQMQNKSGLQPVRENGLEFVVVTDPVWRLPAAGKETTINLAVKITGRDKEPVYMPLCYAFCCNVKREGYGELKLIGGGHDHFVFGRRTPALRNGKSFTEPIRLKVSRSKDGKQTWVAIEHSDDWTLLELPEPGPLPKETGKKAAPRHYGRLFFLEVTIRQPFPKSLNPGAREWRGSVKCLPVAILIQ
jgi:hypothetical protein